MGLLIEKSARLASIASALYQEQDLSAVRRGQAADATVRNVRARKCAEIAATGIEPVDIAEALWGLSQDNGRQGLGRAPAKATL